MPASAHEFWLDAEPYLFSPDQPVSVDLRNGQSFHGTKLPYLPNNIARFELHHESQILRYVGRTGDFPAYQSNGLPEGLVSVVHETTPATITYETLEEFRAFALDKGRADVVDSHRARGLPVENFTEIYTRHAKALLAVGEGLGTDRSFGMKTEFIALTNPYDPSFNSEMQVELRLDQMLQPAVKVTVFQKSRTDDVTVSHLWTNAEGRISLRLSPGHRYLLDAVAFAAAPEGGDAVWRTYWASLTFAAPE